VRLESTCITYKEKKGRKEYPKGKRREKRRKLVVVVVSHSTYLFVLGYGGVECICIVRHKNEKKQRKSEWKERKTGYREIKKSGCEAYTKFFSCICECGVVCGEERRKSDETYLTAQVCCVLRGVLPEGNARKRRKRKETQGNANKRK
jgi:hypothetical protein